MSKQDCILAALILIFITLYCLGSSKYYGDLGAMLQWVAIFGWVLSLTQFHISQMNKWDSLPILPRTDFIKTMSSKYPDIPEYYTIRICEFLEDRLKIPKERIDPDMDFSKISKLIPGGLSGVLKKVLKVKYQPQCKTLKIDKDATVGEYIHTLFIHSVDPNVI